MKRTYGWLISRASTRENQAQFFGIAARVMRRILVDEARKRKSDKRGGDVIHVALNEAGSSNCTHTRPALHIYIGRLVITTTKTPCLPHCEGVLVGSGSLWGGLNLVGARIGPQLSAMNCAREELLVKAVGCLHQ